MKSIIILIMIFSITQKVIPKEDKGVIYDSYAPPSDVVNFNFSLIGARSVIVTLKEYSELIEDNKEKAQKSLQHFKEVTKIIVDFKFHPEAKNHKFRVKGEKKFTLELPTKETSFLKMHDLKIGAVSCNVHNKELHVRIDYNLEDEPKSIIYHLSLDGKFLKSKIY